MVGSLWLGTIIVSMARKRERPCVSLESSFKAKSFSKQERSTQHILKCVLSVAILEAPSSDSAYNHTSPERFWGAWQKLQKCCVHFHEFIPYFCRSTCSWQQSMHVLKAAERCQAKAGDGFRHTGRWNARWSPRDQGGC